MILNSTNITPKMSQTSFGQRIKIKEISSETPSAAKTILSTGTSVTSNELSSGTGPFASIVGPFIKLVAVVSPGLAAWIMGNPSSGGTLTSSAATATANIATIKVVEVIIDKDNPKDPS